MTILDLVRILRANLRTLVVAAVLGLVLAAAYTATLPVQYTTSNSVQVSGGNSIDANSAMLSEQLASSRAGYYAKLASSPGVADRIVAKSKGALKPSDFTVSGASEDGTATVTLSAVSGDPAKAQRAADLAQAALGEQAHYLETRTAKSTIYEVFPLTTAPRPSTPSSPNWRFNLAAGLAGGIIAGIAYIVLRKQLDSRVRHTSEVEAITDRGVLGIIPKAAALQTDERGGLGNLGPTAESFRMLRTNLRYVSPERPPRSLVVTSAVQGEGKSTVSANLARVLAAAGQHVILVDTDLRRPTVHSTFGVENLVGLTEVLTGQARLRDVVTPGDHSNLHLLSSGRIPPNPSELLGSRRMSAIIDALSEHYFVVLDAPPLLPVTDAGLLAVAADGAAVVYHHGHTHREQIELCTKILDQVGAHYYGSILNMTPPKQMGSTVYGYGAGKYSSGYGDGYGESSDESRALTPSSEVEDLTLGVTAPQEGATDQRGGSAAPEQGSAERPSPPSESREEGATRSPRSGVFGGESEAAPGLPPTPTVQEELPTRRARRRPIS